jgi:hypothetical protein
MKAAQVARIKRSAAVNRSVQALKLLKDVPRDASGHRGARG